MAELSIRWESVERISNEKARGVVTGDSAEDATKVEEAKSPLRWTNKPLVVYVCDEAAGCDGFDKLEEVVLKDEKVGLGMKAFRTVKIHPDDAANDEFLKDHGKEVPRMLVIEPVTLKVTVLEKGKLKTSKLYGAMTKVANKFYKQKVDKVVKTHLKLLTEQDQLANQQKVLQTKMGRLSAEEGGKAKKDLAKAKEEMAEVNEELETLRTKTKEIWKLEPKAKKA